MVSDLLSHVLRWGSESYNLYLYLSSLIIYLFISVVHLLSFFSNWPKWMPKSSLLTKCRPKWKSINNILPEMKGNAKNYLLTDLGTGKLPLCHIYTYLFEIYYGIDSIYQFWIFDHCKCINFRNYFSLRFRFLDLF